MRIHSPWFMVTRDLRDSVVELARSQRAQLGITSGDDGERGARPGRHSTCRRAATRTLALAHAQLVEKARRGGIDVYFAGDSITRRWGTSDAQYRDFLDNWTRNFFGWNAANFGWGGDTVPEHPLACHRG